MAVRCALRNSQGLYKVYIHYLLYLHYKLFLDFKWAQKSLVHKGIDQTN